MKKNLVISGINLYSGGTLSIYKDLLREIIDNRYNQEYKVTIFVHKKELFNEFENDFELIELPKSRKNYIYRMYYEYAYFYFYSLRHSVDIWLSIHDMTPNVRAKNQYVYCHNPSPFLKRDAILWRYSKKNYLMSLLYRYVYRINIRRNNAVIVQQDWIRQKFKEMFRIDNIIVAHPTIQMSLINESFTLNARKRKVFFYPSYPRVFKKFETLCEAAKKLENEGKDFEVWLTLKGNENDYAKMIYQKYSHVKNIKWIGIIDRKEIMDRYAESDYLIFPSILETWGLPISEYKMFNKPIILADLPYAHETVGDYDQVTFFKAEDADSLKDTMKRILDGHSVFTTHKKATVDMPYANNWSELLEQILDKQYSGDRT